MANEIRTDQSSPAVGVTPAVAGLAALPRSEQREALEMLVVGEIRTALLMSERDELPFDVSYFDLGLTSLSVTEVKQRLEILLGRGINANVLFNSPTVRRLLDYLTEDLLADVLAAPAAARPATVPAPADAALVNDVLRELYRG